MMPSQLSRTWIVRVAGIAVLVGLLAWLAFGHPGGTRIRYGQPIARSQASLASCLRAWDRTHRVPRTANRQGHVSVLGGRCDIRIQAPLARGSLHYAQLPDGKWSFERSSVDAGGINTVADRHAHLRPVK